MTMDITSKSIGAWGSLWRPSHFEIPNVRTSRASLMDPRGILSLSMYTSCAPRVLSCLDLALDYCLSPAGCGRREANEELLEDVDFTMRELADRRADVAHRNNLWGKLANLN